MTDLSSQVMTLNPVCENVETAQGVPLTVTGVAQVTNFEMHDVLLVNYLDQPKKLSSWKVFETDILGENNEEPGITAHSQRTIFGQEGT